MNREEFSDLLKRYLDNTCSEEEKEVINDWYSHFDLKKGSVKEAMTAPNMQELIWNQIQHKIGDRDKNARPNTKLIWRNRLVRFAVAASLVIAGGFAYFQIKTNNLSSFLAVSDRAMVTEVNNSIKIKTVFLPDGTQINMQPGSRLHFPKPFRENKREVRLEGEAYFNVTKNASKPFIVYAGEVSTKVVGTSFIIKSGDKNLRDVEVSVITGKVIVEKNESSDAKPVMITNNGVILTPNQKVVYYQKEDHFVTGVVDAPVVIKGSDHTNKPSLFDFNETPLHEVLERLQTAYGLKFELINENISNCPVTADLHDQPLYTKLEIISASLNARYELKGTSIVLSGGRCD